MQLVNKRYLLCILMIFSFIFLSCSKSKMIFTIDSPNISDPLYKFKDFKMSLKSIVLTNGLYSGFGMVFSENLNDKDSYSFIIYLPFNNKFRIEEVEHEKYKLSNGELPLHISNDDFDGGVYNARTNEYIYPVIKLQKYYRDSNNVSNCMDLFDFKIFDMNIIYFQYYKNHIDLKLELKGYIYIHELNNDTKYNLSAFIDIIDEKLFVTYTD